MRETNGELAKEAKRKAEVEKTHTFSTKTVAYLFNVAKLDCAQLFGFEFETMFNCLYQYRKKRYSKNEETSTNAPNSVQCKALYLLKARKVCCPLEMKMHMATNSALFQIGRKKLMGW